MLRRLSKFIRRFGRSESGPTASEYAILLALVAIVLVLSINLLGQHVDNIFSDITDGLENTAGSAGDGGTGGGRGGGVGGGRGSGGGGGER